MNPEPIPNKNPPVLDFVLKDLIGRGEHGLQTYGTKLQPDNGRNPLQDAYEEVLDLCLYLKQALLEQLHARYRIKAVNVPSPDMTKLEIRPIIWDDTTGFGRSLHRTFPWDQELECVEYAKAVGLRWLRRYE